MGTKAVFAIEGYNKNIVGMTMDGMPNNLAYIANECWQHAKKLRVLTKFKQRDEGIITKVLEAVVNDPKNAGWLFLDDPKNPSWVSYSAKMDIKTKTVRQFENHFNHETSVVKLTV